MMLFGMPLEDHSKALEPSMHGTAMTPVLGQIRVDESDRNGQPFQGLNSVELPDAKSHDGHGKHAGKQEMHPTMIAGRNLRTAVILTESGYICWYGFRHGGSLPTITFAMRINFRAGCRATHRVVQGASF